MTDLLIGLASIVATITIFGLASMIYKKYPISILLPILTSVLTIVSLLLLLQIPYETYMIGGKWLDHLLGPAVVALAYPLYKQWQLLRAYMLPIMMGVFMGSIIGVSSGIALTNWLSFTEEILYSIASKSVTTPVSMEVTTTIGGVPSLAAIFVIIAGITGATLGKVIFSKSKLTNKIATGVGMGTASHAIGTARIMRDGELEGAVSSVAMTISAIIVATFTPFLVQVLL
ncbi:LrgB family protein [Aquibacillus sediminis]|uniref:LrgB family protein n=1 Tax=Aquibacillus sediminis TaxID=2574734 RepID=UPI001108A226|nr:LrgB family protein [Aquibacillus sediminis]